ncbi:hypothetical protein [Halorhabdus sp. BNX81]|uniref:hypothetical protein n=1 Tax=Halorhabdus sp. BNX81 TaxID=2980181 RepID=UPI0023DD05AD|nr:hypothetical protein [Halorhabdus sp. BNX81]WEL22739.1 putative membrane protein [Halorhabdus sp. BNX81]
MAGSGTTRIATLVMGLSVSAGVWLLVGAGGSMRATAVSALAGGTLGIAVLLSAGETPLRRAVSTLFVPVTAVLLVGGFGLAIFDGVLGTLGDGFRVPVVGRALLAHVGVAVAASAGTFGVLGTITDGIGDGAVARFWKTAITTEIVLVAALGLLVALRFDALDLPTGDLSAAADPFLRPADPRVALVTFWLIVAGGLVMGRRTLSALPLVELAGRSSRPQLETGLDRADSVLRSATVAVVAVTFLSALGFATDPDAGVFAMESIQPVLSVLENQPLRRALVAVTLALGAIVLVVGGLQRVTGSVTGLLRRLIPSILGGVVVIVAAWFASPFVAGLLADVPATYRPSAASLLDALTPAGALLAAVAVAVFLLAVLLAMLVGAGGVSYVPARNGGGAIASAGLAVGTILVGVAGGGPVVVFAGVALSIVAWNASERGVTTRAELGARGALHLDVVHTVAALSVALPGMAVAWLLYSNTLSDLAVPGGTLVGVLATLAASLVLLVALRG